MNILPLESFSPTVSKGLFSFLVFSTVLTMITFGKASNNLNLLGISQAKIIIYFWMPYKFLADLPNLTFIINDSISSLLKSLIWYDIGLVWELGRKKRQILGQMKWVTTTLKYIVVCIYLCCGQFYHVSCQVQAFHSFLIFDILTQTITHLDESFWLWYRCFLFLSPGTT